MTKYFLLLILTLFSFNVANAHQADISSTMLVEKEDGTWILQIKAALTAFEYEVHTHYGKDSYATAEAFQELAISHLKENISILLNEKYIATFKSANIKLGHETNAVFELSDIPEKWESITVKNSSFKRIYKNKSALIILKKGFSKDQFILNEANGHQLKLRVDKTKFVAVSNINQIGNYLYYIIAGVVVIIGVFVFLWKKRGKA